MRMVSNTEAELKISVACKKSMQPGIVGHAYMYDKHYMPCLKIKYIPIGKK